MITPLGMLGAFHQTATEEAFITDKSNSCTFSGTDEKIRFVSMN